MSEKTSESNGGLPADIKALVTDEGVFLELNSFIEFLRNDKDIPAEYKSESLHLKKIADYLESQHAELLAQHKLIQECLDESLPN